MKRIFQYGFALALAACSFAACSDDDTGENGVKTDVTLSPSTSLTGVSFSANTLNVSNNGIYPSASIAVKKADGSALSGVTLQVELSNNSASEEWCQIEPKNNALQFTVQPYEGGEAARSIDVRLTGSGNGVSINPFTFKVVQAPTPKRAEAHILDFSIQEQTQPAEIDYEKMTITVNVPFGNRRHGTDARNRDFGRSQRVAGQRRGAGLLPAGEIHRDGRRRNHQAGIPGRRGGRGGEEP